MEQNFSNNQKKNGLVEWVADKFRLEFTVGKELANVAVANLSRNAAVEEFSTASAPAFLKAGHDLDDLYADCPATV